jgi:hypothetical protein
MATLKKRNTKRIVRPHRNLGLQLAQQTPKDEFYTQLSDIEKEVKYYKEHFYGKVILCNCDDPRVSNFFHYFSYNFKKLGLKKLITTCYKNQNADLFSDNKSEKAIYLEYTGQKNGENVPTPEEIGIKPLSGNGDFRSQECIELLKESDIVVTNPPFSLFQDYVAQLVKYDKKFLILGNQNAITLVDCFKLIKNNKMWLGASIHSGDREFGVPDEYPLTASTCRTDENGKKYVRVKGVRWFTNLDYNKRHENMILFQTYAPERYPTFDNFHAINISKTKDIPMDYDGIMGVPITFFDKYNPEQFEIVGSDYEVREGILPEIVNHNWNGNFDRGYINGNRKFARILIKRKH